MIAGTRVRLRSGSKITRIVRKFRGVPGGVILAERLGGFRCWNVRDLVAVRRPR